MHVKSLFIIFIIALLTFSVSDLGAQKYVHRDYDWEGDDSLEVLPGPAAESCYPCHFGGMFPQPGYKRKQCEDCHVINESLGKPIGPYTYYDLGLTLGGVANFTLRKDYDAPTISSHLSSKSVPVTSYSSCLYYDPETGQGVCHGVSQEFGDIAGGFFAFNASIKKFQLDNPYLKSFPVQHLPNSLDCLFCHHQGKKEVRQAWGDAKQIRISKYLGHHNASKNEDCLPCHVRANSFENFHSPGIFTEGRASFLPLIAAASGFLALFGYYLLRKRSGGSGGTESENFN